jgi:hypothetical protein
MPVILTIWEAKIRRILVQEHLMQEFHKITPQPIAGCSGAGLGKKQDLISKITKVKRARKGGSSSRAPASQM